MTEEFDRVTAAIKEVIKEVDPASDGALNEDKCKMFF